MQVFGLRLLSPSREPWLLWLQARARMRLVAETWVTRLPELPRFFPLLHWVSYQPDLDSRTGMVIIEGLFSPQEGTAMFTPGTRLPVMLIGCCMLVLGLWLGTVVAKRQAPQRPPLSPEKRDAFLAGKWNAILATIKKDGSPQLTPVWYRWDGEQF